MFSRFISETSHGLVNVKTINQRHIGTICVISRLDIVLTRLHCSNKSPGYIVAAKFVVTISRSELRIRFNDLLNEAIVYDESMSVYVIGTVE